MTNTQHAALMLALEAIDDKLGRIVTLLELNELAGDPAEAFGPRDPTTGDPVPAQRRGKRRARK